MTISSVVPAAITAVNANPTIVKNGSAIQPPMCVMSIAVNPSGGGTGYSHTSPPAVTVTAAGGDPGFGCLATATVSTGGVVTAINVTQAGGNYLVAPSVAIAPPGSGTTATATATLGPFWTPSQLSVPWVAYQLPSTAASTDVFTFSAPSGWLTSGSYSLPAALSGTPITNYTGESEAAPLGWGLVNFGTNLGVMGLGMNVAYGSTYTSPYCHSRNWIHRVSFPWLTTPILGAAAVTFDDTGHPLQVTSSSGVAYCSAISTPATPVAAGVGYPAITGTYTYIADDNGTLVGGVMKGMPVALSGSSAVVITANGGNPPAGSTGTGLTWTWQVEWASPLPADQDPFLVLEVSTPSGGPGPWTQSGEWFSVPQAFAPAGVLGITLVSAGSGYSGSVTVTIGAPNTPGGVTATATTTVSLGAISPTFTITNPGSGYTAPPPVTINGNGTGATAVAFLNGPAPTIDRTDPAAIDANVAAWLTLPSGKPPQWLRYMDGLLGNDAETSIVDVEDLRNVGDFSWVTTSTARVTAALSGGAVVLTVLYPGSGYTSAPNVVLIGGTTTGTAASFTANLGSGATAGQVAGFTPASSGTSYTVAPAVYITDGFSSPTPRGKRTVLVTSLGTFNPTPGSPGTIYTSDNWPGTTATPSGPLPYAWTVTNLGFALGTGQPSTWAVIEATTASPHYFKTGQIVSVAAPAAPTTITLNNSSDTPLVYNVGASPGFGCIWVTGPNTFLYTVDTGLTKVTYPGYVQTGAAVTMVATVNTPGDGVLPYEVAADASNVLNANVHINVPASATLACHQEIAGRVLATVSRNVLVGVEYTNEHFDTAFGHNWALFSYGYMQTPSLTYDQIYVQRMAQVHQIWVNTFAAAGRGNQIVRLCGGWYGQSPTATNSIAAANAQTSVTVGANTYSYPGGTPVNTIMLGIYPSCPGDLPYVTAGR